MKRILITLLFINITVNIYAQDNQGFHLGLKIAPSLAWLKSESDGYTSDGSKFGFAYGVIADFNFAPKYAIGTGLEVSYRGGKFKTIQQLKTTLNEDSVVSTSSNYTMKYIEIPITLKLKTNEIGALTYFLQIGVAPGANLSAYKSYDATIQTKVGGTIETTTESKKDVGNSDEINNFNVSMIIGGGLQYKISGETLLLAGLQFNNGFLDAFNGDPKVNTNYFALTLGVLF